MSPRVIQLPVSGRDRRHYARELARVERMHENLVKEAAAAHDAAERALRQAHRLDCEVWNTRQFIGGPAEPSSSIAVAIHGGCELLEAQCKRCGHTELVDLVLVIWPREKPIHALERALNCQPCKARGRSKQRPNLVALRAREETPSPEPARTARKA
jgi:hypothetical protein